MTDNNQRQVRRRRYFVDKPMQFHILATIFGCVIVTGLFVAGVMYLMPADDSAQLSVADARNFALKILVSYAALFIIVLAWLAIVVTHRVAGPVYVLENALVGLLKGEYQHRVVLRDGDYLKGMAELIGKLRDQIIEERVRRGEQIDKVLTIVRENNQTQDSWR